MILALPIDRGAQERGSAGIRRHHNECQKQKSCSWQLCFDLDRLAVFAIVACWMASLATDCRSGASQLSPLFRFSLQPTDTGRNSETFSPDDVAGGLGLWRDCSEETGLVGKEIPGANKRAGCT